MQAFSSCSEPGSTLLGCVGFSLLWLLLLQSAGSVLVAQGLSCLRHVELDLEWNLYPCTGRWILSHWTTKEVLLSRFPVTGAKRESGVAALPLYWGSPEQKVPAALWTQDWDGGHAGRGEAVWKSSEY